MRSFVITVFLTFSTSALADGVHFKSKDFVGKKVGGSKIKDPNGFLESLEGQFFRITNMGLTLTPIETFSDLVFRGDGYYKMDPFVNGGDLIVSKGFPNIAEYSFNLLVSETRVEYVDSILQMEMRQSLFQVSLSLVLSKKNWIVNGLELRDCRGSTLLNVEVETLGRASDFERVLKDNKWKVYGTVMTKKGRDNALRNHRRTAGLYGIELSDEESESIQSEIDEYMKFREYFVGDKTGEHLVQLCPKNSQVDYLSFNHLSSYER